MAAPDVSTASDLGQADVAPDAPAVGPRAAAWVVLGILCLVYVLNFLDRQLLSILAKPIQDTLHVSDSQLGLIGGLYFAVFYCFISIPVGWLADRTNRVTVLSLACTIWSGATMACGLATTYPQLKVLDVMRLTSPNSAILSAVIFNALIIVALIPLALQGVRYRALGAAALLRRNLLIYGVGGIALPFAGIKLIDMLLSALRLI